MSRQTEDIMYEILKEVQEKGLQDEFTKQRKKMATQSKHKFKTVCEVWEYALKRITEN